jgi:hypothetical protein
MWAWQGDSSNPSGTCVPGTTVLAPGASCVTFFGTGGLATVGNYSASDRISYRTQALPSTYTLDQAYTFSIGTMVLSVPYIDLGTVNQYVSTSKTFTITNAATNGGPLYFSKIGYYMADGDPEYFGVSHNCGTQLAAGASCTVTVSFNPLDEEGSVQAFLDIQGSYHRMSAGVDQNVVMPGAGVVRQLTISGDGDCHC